MFLFSNFLVFLFLSGILRMLLKMLYIFLNLFKIFVEVVFFNIYLFVSLVKLYYVVIVLVVLKLLFIIVLN